MGFQLPAIPKLNNMCGCLEVKRGVLIWSAVLTVLWIIYLIDVLIANVTIGSKIWGVIWAVAGVAVYGLVVFALWKDKPRNYLLPAMFVSAFNVVVSVINAIINFVFLAWLGAIILLIIAAITLYYFLGLYTVYQDASAPPAGEPDLKLPA